MYLSELLNEITISNSREIGTPIEVAYYDNYSWQHEEQFEGLFFAALDSSFVDSAEFIDGEVMELEITDLGLTVHVVAIR